MAHKITLDARWLVGGIGTYILNLLAGICRAEQDFEVQAITRLKHLKDVQRFCRKVQIVDAPIYTLREQFAIRAAARGSALLHVPHYNGPLLFRGRLLVSIHDVIHLTDSTYSRSAKALLYARPMLKLITQKADHIVTVSEYSKREIVRRLGVSATKVTVIYNGVSNDFHPANRDQSRAAARAVMGVSVPYFLYVGSLKIYKNVSALVRAFALLRNRRHLGHRLVIVGNDPKGRRVLSSECAKLGIESFVSFIECAPPDLLAKLYSAADFLVMPSRIEGFGLPVLEAMACGTPVISSNAASLPEVGGNAVLYFDPSRYEDLADQMENLLDSAELRQALIDKGLRRAKQFTWDQSTTKHLELYRTILFSS